MAGMAPDFDITLEGMKKPKRVQGRFQDITAFERWSKTQPGTPTMTGDPMTFAEFVAWRAAVRDQVTDLGFDEFDAAIIDLVPVVEEVDENPTK